MTTLQKISSPTRATRNASTSPNETRQTLAITVLAGGPGAEREVSLESGKAVHAALLRLGHHAILRDIGPNDLSGLDEPADFVFIALHGEFGEDGVVQRILEDRRIPFSGSGSASSAIAMDKSETKLRIDAIGLPTPSWRLADPQNFETVVSSFGLPAIVKPVASGSSVDTAIAHDCGALRDAAAHVVRRHGQALIETYVRGRELTVGVLGQKALPVCEIRTRREFYNYQAKYLDDDTQYLFDLDLPESLLCRVQDMSLKAHEALGCRVLSRVDWMVDAETSEPYFLEVNTIPGFTSHSLVPKSAARVGFSFDQLCQRIVELSLAESGADA